MNSVFKCFPELSSRLGFANRRGESRHNLENITDNAEWREGRPAHQVAYLTGFADQSHLTRNFKRIVGVTPASFAKGARTRALARTPALGYWCASTPRGIVAAPEPVPRIA